MALEIFDERLKRRLPGIFPGQSLASMRPEVMSETVVEQEPMPERINVSEYLDAISEINSKRAKMSGRVNAMRGLTGRSQNFSFGAIAGEQELKQRMGIRDEEIQDEILNRQRAAILGGEISNIDEQMAWYQKGGYDPHFAKTAREAAQSIFDQRGQERGFEIRETVEARGVRGAELKEEEAVRAQQRFDFAKAEADRKQKEFNAKQTTESRNELISAREDELLRWAASKWWDLEPGERTEAKREEIGREMTVLAENESFQGFEIVAGEVVPKLGRGITTTPPVSFDLDEKSLLDTFRNEAKVVLKDADKEDEDFVTVPARKYFDQFKADWDVAADDWDTAQAYTREIEKAIAADPDISKENQRAVLKGVLDSLGELEEPVGRPAEVAPLTDERRMNELITAVTTLTGDLPADRATRHKAHIRIKRENRIQNPFVRALTRDEQDDEGFIQIEDFLSIDEETAIDLDIQQSFMDRINAVNEMRKLDDLSAFILEADPSFKIPAGYDADELKKAILRKIKRDYEDFTVMPRGYSESVIRRNKED